MLISYTKSVASLLKASIQYSLFSDFKLKIIDKHRLMPTYTNMDKNNCKAHKDVHCIPPHP